MLGAEQTRRLYWKSNSLVDLNYYWERSQSSEAHYIKYHQVKQNHLVKATFSYQADQLFLFTHPLSFRKILLIADKASQPDNHPVFPHPPSTPVYKSRLCFPQRELRGKPRGQWNIRMEMRCLGDSILLLRPPKSRSTCLSHPRMKPMIVLLCRPRVTPWVSGQTRADPALSSDAEHSLLYLSGVSWFLVLAALPSNLHCARCNISTGSCQLKWSLSEKSI